MTSHGSPPTPPRSYAAELPPITPKCNGQKAEVEWEKARDGAILEGSAAPPRSGRTEDPQMHSILVGAIFVSMVLAPCVIAMFTGIE